jgi:hypothetical protein
MVLLLPALCEALSDAGVRVFMGNDRRPKAQPPGNVTQEMYAGLKHYKPEIIRALGMVDRSKLIELFPCGRCGSDVVLEREKHCATCAQLINKSVTMEPGSTAEFAYLESLNAYAESLK